MFVTIWEEKHRGTYVCVDLLSAKNYVSNLLSWNKKFIKFSNISRKAICQMARTPKCPPRIHVY